MGAFDYIHSLINSQDSSIFNNNVNLVLNELDLSRYEASTVDFDKYVIIILVDRSTSVTYQAMYHTKKKKLIIESSIDRITSDLILNPYGNLRKGHYHKYKTNNMYFKKIVIY